MENMESHSESEVVQRMGWNEKNRYEYFSLCVGTLNQWCLFYKKMKSNDKGKHKERGEMNK